MVDSQQPTNIYESESKYLEKTIEEYKSESVELQQPIDVHEHEPNEELAGTSELELTMGGRRYPLRAKREPTRFTN